MNTKLVLYSCAVILAITGITFIFLPMEIAEYLNLGNAGTAAVIIQAAASDAGSNLILISAAIGYTLFAILFGLILFGNPLKEKS